jgi:hypothetical protein
MKSRCVNFILCVVTILAVYPALAEDSALRGILEKRYAAMKAAMADRNATAVSSLLAPDFVSVDISGQSENATQMIQEVSTVPNDPLKVSDTTLLSIKASDNTAVVSQRYDMKTTKTAPDGSKRNIELITMSTDTWIKSNGIWLIQKTVTDQLDYSVNGQSTIHKIRATEK